MDKHASIRLRLIVSTCLLGLWASGCGGSDPAPADAATRAEAASASVDAATSMSTRGSVRGTVSYAGAGTGRLTVGIWPSTPPAGPPVDFFAATDPSFPIAYEITGLPAGTYYLGIVYDLGANNPTIPGAEDPRSFPSAAIEIVGGDSHTIDVTLTDPDTTTK